MNLYEKLMLSVTGFAIQELLHRRLNHHQIFIKAGKDITQEEWAQRFCTSNTIKFLEKCGPNIRELLCKIDDDIKEQTADYIKELDGTWNAFDIIEHGFWRVLLSIQDPIKWADLIAMSK